MSSGDSCGADRYLCGVHRHRTNGYREGKTGRRRCRGLQSSQEGLSTALPSGRLPITRIQQHVRHRHARRRSASPSPAHPLRGARYAPEWRAGFGYEFMERPDGYQGWAKSYDLTFPAPPRIMDLGLLYRALAEKQVDVVAGNSTDGLIAAMDMAVLEDDRHYFPPYEAVPI